jgi:hypothetical protein
VPAVLVEGARDVIALHLRERARGFDRRGLRELRLELEQLGTDQRSGREHDRALQHVEQLADVPRPRVRAQPRHRGRGDAGRGLVELACGAMQQAIDERIEILEPVAQRRHLEHDDAQPMIEVFTEPSRLDLAP